MKKLIGTFSIAFIGALAGVLAMKYGGFTAQPQIVERVVHEATPVRYSLAADGSNPLDFTMAAERTVNMVVHVKTESTVQNSLQNPWLDLFGYDASPQVQRGSGSGVIISEDGFIVTNNHVIEGATKIMVSLNNNKSYDAAVIGTDPSTDIAVLKIEASSLPYITFGNSDDLRIGEWVLAVGNPFDLTSTVTAGIVSAKARNINILGSTSQQEIFPIESFIQTDAAVNPGNSGGALVNTRGELIGINTAIASRTGSYSGYSFAVPSSIVSKVTADMMEYGIVQRAFIGVRISELTQELATESGLNDLQGVYVSELIESGAAAEAGIEEGDVILRVGRNKVKTVPELQEQVSRYRPGDSVDITVWRDGQELVLPLTLKNARGNTDLAKADVESTRSLLGAELTQIEGSDLKLLGIRGGVQVTALSPGKFSEAGIQKSFIITKVDGSFVTTPDEVYALLSNKSGGVLIEGLYPNGKKAYYGFGL
jgi:Do/DeqQ family serine protease